MATDNKTSVLVENLLPDFLDTEGPKFQSFVKAYYEWMETTGQMTEQSKNLLNNQDIDLAAEEFLKYFKREILSQFPEDVLADKRLVYKKIKDLYRSKGSEESYKLLFRILYNEELDFYYPGQDILRASDGRWVKETSIRLTKPVKGNIYNLAGTITGRKSGATARVERVQQKYDDGIEVFEVFISNISGTFLDAEEADNTSNTISGIINSKSGALQGVIILDGGSGHRKNDVVSLTSASGTGGRGIVNVTDDGSIVSLTVSNTGSGFVKTDEINIINLTRSGFLNGGLDIEIVDGGHGFTVGTPITLTGGSGAGASLQVSSITNANTISIGGTVYTFGTISNVEVITQGTGYFELPTASVKDTTIASLNLNNIDFELVSGGSGYTTGATISISGGNGTGALFQIDSISNTEILPLYTDTINGLAGTPLNALPFGSANTATISASLAAANINSTLISALNYVDTTVGTIGSITRLSSGNNYTSSPSVSVVQQNVSDNDFSDGAGGFKGRNAVITANLTPGFIGNTGSAILRTTKANADALGGGLLTAPISYTGRYTDVKGFLSWSNKLQDNRYFQEYSYVLRSSQVLNTYKEIVKNVVHPAGMRIFGDVLINVDVDNTTKPLQIETVLRLSDIVPPAIFIPTVVSASIDQYESSGDDGAIVPRPELEIEQIETFFDIDIPETGSGFQLEIELIAAQQSALLAADQIISVNLVRLIENVTLNESANVATLPIGRIWDPRVPSSNTGQYFANGSVWIRDGGTYFTFENSGQILEELAVGTTTFNNGIALNPLLTPETIASTFTGFLNIELETFIDINTSISETVIGGVTDIDFEFDAFSEITDGTEPFSEYQINDFANLRISPNYTNKPLNEEVTIPVVTEVSLDLGIAHLISGVTSIDSGLNIGTASVDFNIDLSSINTTISVPSLQIDMDLGGASLISISSTTSIEANNEIYREGSGFVTTVYVGDIDDVDSFTLAQFADVPVETLIGERRFISGEGTDFVTETSNTNPIMIRDSGNTNSLIYNQIQSVYDANTMFLTSNVAITVVDGDIFYRN